VPPIGAYVLVAAVAAVGTFALMFPIRSLATRAGFVVEPDERRVHTRVTPYGGGAAMFLAFAVAILGGLTNPWGVVIAGLAYGLVEACATTWLGSSSTQIVTFTAVIAALALAPSGLFGGRTRVRV